MVQNKKRIAIYTISLQALKIKEKPLEYLCEEFAWGYVPYDLAAISAYNIGIKEKSREYGEKALSLNPNDDRLMKNMSWYLITE